MAVSFQLVERASQSFTSADVKSVKSVFCRDMCVAENTLRGASVELSAYSGQLRRRAQRILLEKVALPLMQQFFDRDAVELRERAEIRRAGVGRAVLPLADRLTADAERLGDELLRHLFFRPVRLERFAERAADGLLLLAHVFGLDVLSQRLDEQHEEVDDRAVDRKRDWE